MKAHSVTPVFQVSDLGEALKHYTEVLGFTEDFRFGEYAGVRLGEACLHLCSHQIHHRPLGGGTTCVFCDEVDDYYARIKARGAHVKTEPQDYPYGMRDFMVVDPDGNHLSFGCAIENS